MEARFTGVMALEIERKYLVKDETWRSGVSSAVGIRQFYVAVMEGRNARIRIRDDGKALLTLKFGGSGAQRDEYEYAIALDDAEDMARFALGNIIEKTRHHVHYAGYLYEIDVFAGKLAGLVLAEIETADDIAAIDLPPWLGRDVTDDAAYYNASLALNGIPSGR